MRAIAVPEIGGIPALVDLPRPNPGPNEILVRLTAASLNPIDADLADGSLPLPSTLPLILGVDGAGRVAAVGESVSGFAPGDLVHGQFLDVPLRSGTYAEYAVIAEHPNRGALQRTPDGMALEVAAALPTAGMTAIGIIERLDLGPGRTILITGATGGVGVFAVQLAAARGAEVIATARPDADAQIRGLGASQTIDYSRHDSHDSHNGHDDVAERVRKSHLDGIDAFLDLTRDSARFAEYAALVRDGGAAVSATFTAPQDLLDSERIAVTNYMMDDKPALLARITEEVSSGRITVPIGRTITLDQVPESFGQSTAGGARGKTVVRI